MTAKPLGFIVIDKDGVRFERMPQPSLLPLALGVLIGVALAMRLQAAVLGRECALADGFDGAAPQGGGRADQGGMRHFPRRAGY